MSDVIRSADISPDGRYRYELTRTWGPGRRAVFVMLNPSTADALRDDPTIRRCIGFARAWGCEQLVVVNCFALRATKPSALLDADDPVGPRNHDTLTRLIGDRRTWITVAAWGGWFHSLNRRNAARIPRGDHDVLGIADDSSSRLSCLGVTKHGAPRHPLYVPADTPFQPWPAGMEMR